MTRPTARPSTTTTKPVAPGAPACGVTDDTIKIGFAFIDVNAVREQFGVDLGNTPDETFRLDAGSTPTVGSTVARSST